MRYSRLWCALLMLLGFSKISFAYTPLCAPEMLDVHLRVPSIEANSSAHLYLLAVEFRNRGRETCQFTMPTVKLQGDEAEFELSGDADHAASAEAFKGRGGLLPVGETAHFVRMWSSMPAGVSTQRQICGAADGLTMNFSSPLSPMVFFTVRHLWMSQCGEGWQSQMRAGPYVNGEDVPSEWLARFNGSRRDLLEPPIPVASGLRLWSLDPIEYLPTKVPFPNQHGYFGFVQFWMDRVSGGLPSCAVTALKRREEDGETTEVLTHCHSGAGAQVAASTSRVALLPREFDLKPQRVGDVEYEVEAALPEGGSTSALLKLDMRDPDAPMLPAIDTRLQVCKAEQLRLAQSSDLGDQWNRPRNYAEQGKILSRGRAFSVENRSDESCLLGGVPSLTETEPPENPANTLNIAICRECSNTLFTPHGNHWIELKPHSQAHFIAMTKTVDQSYFPICTVIGGLNVDLEGGSIALPFLTSTCAKLTVSAWRDGAYQGDALAPPTIEKAVSEVPVPKECSEKVSESTGEPVFFSGPEGGPRDRVLFGVSSRPMPARKGAPIMIWLANTTDRPKQLMTCQDLDGFFMGTFDILDSDGHRVLEKNEVRARKEKSDVIVMRQLSVCTMNVAITIKPHSCANGDFNYPSPFVVKPLGGLYDLPAGYYQLVPRADSTTRTERQLNLPIEVLP